MAFEEDVMLIVKSFTTSRDPWLGSSTALVNSPNALIDLTIFNSTLVIYKFAIYYWKDLGKG